MPWLFPNCQEVAAQIRVRSIRERMEASPALHLASAEA